MSRRRVRDFFQLGAIAGVVQQFRPPQLNDFGGGGIDSPLYVDARTGEAFLLVNGVITPFPWSGLNVMSFGARCDGVTDDTSAIQRAMAAAQAKGAGTELYFPGGNIIHKSPLTVSDIPIRLVGGGGQSSAYVATPASACTVLKYQGAATTSAQLSFVRCGMSHGMRGFALDSNSLCDKSLLVDSCMFGIYEDVSVVNPKKWGVKLGTDAGGGTVSWNSFRNLRLSVNGPSIVAGIWLTGTVSPAANACHNSFYDTYIDHGGAANANGIDLGNCDNNRFYNPFIFRSSGTGFGVNVITTENPPFPVNNFFFHAQATGGVNMPVGSGALSFHGYSQDNGEPDPSGVGAGSAYWDNGQHLNAPGYFKSGACGSYFGKASAAVVANASLTVFSAGSGLFVIRNLSTGGVVLASVDIGTGLVTSISDPAAIFATADPGGGGNKIWGHVSGSDFVLTNRYAVNKDIGVALVTLYGTPA